ncbi:MAG: S-layer homology domain-containing protein [Actinobacteria bacterium]|nr:S-layer homology domain-containing protein [Actinomycetota bacterium]
MVQYLTTKSIRKEGVLMAKTGKSKVLSLMLVVAMVFGILPAGAIGAFAAPPNGADFTIAQVTGVSATALSQPNVAAGIGDQPAGDIRVIEATVAALGTDDVWLRIQPDRGVTFSRTPEATVTAGDITLGEPELVENNLLRIPVTAESTAAAQITISGIRYNVALSAALGDVDVNVLAGESDVTARVIGAVSNAIVVRPVSATALARPNVVAGFNNQPAGDIRVIEATVAALGTDDVWLRIQPDRGVTFSRTPEATVTAGDITLGEPELVENNLLRIPVTAESTAAAQITISGIRYNVATDTALGDVNVDVLATEDTPTAISTEGLISTISNAIVVRPVSATALARPNVVLGFNNQLAGDIRVIEATATALGANDVWLRIQPDNGIQGVTFSRVPEATVTAGNITIGTPVLAANNLLRIPVTAESTAAAQITVSGIRYNVATDTPLGGVLVDVLAGESTATARLIRTVSNATVVTLAALFPDVPETHFAADAISFLRARGIIQGFPDGTFRPNANVTRAEFAKMAVLSAGLTLIDTETPSFGDAPATHWAFRFIETARAAGIIRGYPDGTFRPNANITRAEIAAIVVRAAGFTEDITGTRFPDVPETHWAFREIMTARNRGIIQGFPDGTFRPNDPATRAEAAVMIFRWVTGTQAQAQ